MGGSLIIPCPPPFFPGGRGLTCISQPMLFLLYVYTVSDVEAAGVWDGYANHPGRLFPMQPRPQSGKESSQFSASYLHEIFFQ